MDQPLKTKKTNQKFGIIYRCLNTITDKSYIGQTRQELDKRISNHFITTAKTKTKFGNALKKYDRDAWQWLILEEAPFEKLDLLEKKYIAEFNTYKDGYNSNAGQNYRTVQKVREKFDKNNTIYTFYSVEHGIISSTMRNMVETYDLVYSGISQIVRGERPRYKNWVMAEFKDDYDRILGLYEFWHPIHGYIKCSSACLEKRYDISHGLISKLISGRYIRAKDWYLLKNRERHKDKRIYRNVE